MKTILSIKYSCNSTVLIICLILLILPTHNILAQETRLITISETIRIALRENINLKQISNLIGNSEIAVEQAGSNFYPNITASASAVRSFQKEDNSFSGLSAQTINTTLSSDVNLFSGFKQTANLQKARLELASDEEDYSYQQQLLMFETSSQFLQVVLDSEFVRIEKENLQVQQQQLQLIEEFWKAGKRSKADLLQQKADIKKAELRVLTAKRNLDINKLQMLQILGQPLTGNFDFASLNVEHLLSFLKNENIDMKTNVSDFQRSDIKAQVLQIEATQKLIKVEQSGYWPSISLFANAGSNYYNKNSALSLSNQLFDNNLNANVGLSFTLPIFDRSTTTHNVERAKIQLTDRELKLKNLQLDVNLDIQNAVQNYQTVLKKREAAKAQYEYSSEALNISEEQYNAGSITFVELSQLRYQNLSAAYGRISSDYDLLLKYIAVCFYKGDIKRAVSIFE